MKQYIVLGIAALALMPIWRVPGVTKPMSYYAYALGYILGKHGLTHIPVDEAVAQARAAYQGVPVA